MNILDRIAVTVKEKLEKRKKELTESLLIRKCSKPVGIFKKNSDITLISECKKGSPSKGVFVRKYYPEVIAEEYEKGGADAISVLTEPDYFFGCLKHLTNVKNAVSIPVLRKDFIIDTYQVKESWAAGADAILLITALLSKAQLDELISCAREYGLDILLEVHNREELEKALCTDVRGIGINARDLTTFKISLKASKDLCALVPNNRIAVAESGMKSPKHGISMYKAGFRGFLVGEYFITADKRENRVREFSDAIKREMFYEKAGN